MSMEERCEEIWRGCTRGATRFGSVHEGARQARRVQRMCEWPEQCELKGPEGREGAWVKVT